MRFLMTTTGGSRTPDEAMMAEMGAFIEEMTKSGVLLATGGLEPGGVRITSSGGEITITDGPFTEAKERSSASRSSRPVPARRRSSCPAGSSGSSAMGTATSTRCSAPTAGEPPGPARTRGPACAGACGGACIGRVTSWDAHRAIEAVWKLESAKIIVVLVRMVGDVGLAEEIAQDAFVTALEQWSAAPQIADNPGAGS